MASTKLKIPSVVQYRQAFLAIRNQMNSQHFKMLRAHFVAPNHTISVEELSRAVRRKGAHLEYGRLARLLCMKLRFRPTMMENGKPVLTQVLADTPHVRSSRSWEWTLRPQVVLALKQLSWINDSGSTNTYILTWNPDNPSEDGFKWDDFKSFVRSTENGKQRPYDWSTGNTTKIVPDDRLFLFRQGKNRGLVASGRATSTVWEEQDRKRRFYVDLKFDSVLPIEQMLPLEQLEVEDLGVHWEWLPASGIEVKKNVDRLEQLWQQHLQRNGRCSIETNLVADVGQSVVPELESGDVKKVLRQIRERLGRPQFRGKLLDAYERRCAITGCNAEAALEAAHIDPYNGLSSNQTSNGLLVRTDIHTLFDLGLVAISPKTMKIALAKELEGTSYDDLAGKLLRLPKRQQDQPNSKALARRWREFERRK